MTSISPSDRAKQEEQLRKTREEYDNREANANRRRDEEVNHLNKRHREELANVEANYNERVDEFKRRSTDLLSERDEKFNKQIEDVRQTYQEALKNKVQQKESEKESIRKTMASDLAKQKQISAGQRENLTYQLNNNYDDRNEQLSRSLEDNRVEAQKAIKENTQRLNHKNMEEKEDLIETYQGALEREQKSALDNKRTMQTSFRAQERRHKTEMEMQSKKLQSFGNQQREEFDDNIAANREVLKANRDMMKDKYAESIERNKIENEEVQEQFRDQVNERIDGQIRSRDVQLREVRDQLAHQIAKNQKQGGMIRSDLVKEYEKRMELVDKAKKDAIDKNRELSNERVAKNTEQNNDLLRHVDRSYRAQKFMDKTKHQEDRENLLLERESEVAALVDKSDKRIKQVSKESADKEKKMGRFLSETVTTMKEDFGERLDTQRERSQMDLLETTKSLQTKAQGTQRMMQEKIEKTESRYQDKIAQLMDNQEQDIRRLEKLFEQKTADKDKGVKMEKESIRQKYEGRITSLNALHDEQMDKMRERHQQELEAVVNRANQYSKKA